MILSDDAKNAMLQGLVDTLNIGANSKLTIYIDTDAAASLTMPNPIEQSIADGVLSFNLPQKVLATLSGTPTTARLTDSSGALIAEFEVGTEVVFDKPSIYAGGFVSLTSLVINI